MTSTMSPKKRAEIFARLQAANPEPTTELAFGSPFQLLVAVILSAQTTDRAVNLATRTLFEAAPTPEKMLALGQEGFEAQIRTIGLYRSKARHVLATCALLLERHGGEVPRTREALEALPGVGRKTANVILNTVFGEPTMAVDTHVFRVANRTGLAAGKTPLEVETALLEAIPTPFKRHAHHWLILHGRYICKAARPECRRCPIVDLCEYPAKEVDPAPTAARRSAALPPSGGGRRKAAARGGS